MSSRRNFLKNIGLVGASGLLTSILTETVIFGQLLKTNAMALGQDLNTNFLNINMGGGPPRYMVDHWLKISAHDPNPLVSPYSATNFTFSENGAVLGQEYKTREFRGYQVPHFFRSLPLEGENILNNMLIVQGYGTGIDGHGINSNLQFYPLAAAPSMGGLVADESQRPFQAARHPDNRSGKFVSSKNISINQLNRENPLGTLLGALVSTSKTRQLAKTTQIKDSFDSARRSLASLDTSSLYKSLALDNLNRGYDLLDSSLGQFQTEWEALYNKYQNIVYSAMRNPNVPGVTCNTDQSKQLYFETNQSDYKFDTGTPDGYLAQGSNLIQLCELSENRGVAAGLALAEFVFKNKLVSVLEIHGGTIDKLLLAPGISTKSFFEIGNDMHGAGGFVANMAMQMYHRGIYAGIAELQDSLKRFGIWDSTHIQLTSEFDRKISFKGGGSGHGTEQMISTLISGKIQNGPYVVGNILNQENINLPSQGYAAPIDNYGDQQQRPSPLTMCSTMAAVISPAYNPWKNVAAPLVTLMDDGKLFLPYGRGRVVLK